MRSQAATAIAALSFVVLCGCDYGGVGGKRFFDVQLPATGIERIVVSGGNGDIRATAGAADRIVVHARLTAQYRRWLESDSVTLARRGNVVYVTSVCPNGIVFAWHVQSCGVDYTISYPRRLQASFVLANGDVAVNGASAGIDARVTNGDVRLDGVSSDVSAEAHQGDVDVTLARAWSGRNISLRTRFGDIRLLVPEGFRAAVHATHLAGQVTLTEIEPGPAIVDASTVFGDVRIEHE
jgi:hypothetical protein